MSSGSESDDDYVPEEPEKVSEEESAGEEAEQQSDNEGEVKTKKRKGKLRNKPKKKLKAQHVQDNDETKTEVEATVNPEEDKKREEDLWAKFLEGTDTKPKPKAPETNNQPVKETKRTVSETITNSEKASDSDKDREKRIFEFAGETIVVENNVIKERVKTAEKPLVIKEGPSPRSRPAAGLSNIVGQLNKKNKLSTLEKSKLDWNTYKKEEGIEDEISSHNKGKDGYLERQDFLGRTDVRQYEIERDLRMSRRSNR